MNRTSLFLLSMAILASALQASAANFPPLESDNQAAKQQIAKQQTPQIAGYLGMGVDYLPATVRAHMPDSVKQDQGVIITRFAEDSPAADDGVKKYDVLIRYEGKPVTKPDELIQTIKNGQPGKVVNLTVVRQGEIIEVPVTLGKQIPRKQHSQVARTTPTGYRQQPHMPQRPPLVNMAPSNWLSNAMPKMPSLKPYSAPPPAYVNMQRKPVYPTPRPMLTYQNGRVRYTGKSYPMLKKIKKKKHAWGDERHIWPDFYTKKTNDMWDSMINAPFDMGRMPGGWRAPSLSSPDPVTIGDAVTNQIPPMVEEMGKMTNFSDK